MSVIGAIGHSNIGPVKVLHSLRERRGLINFWCYCNSCSCGRWSPCRADSFCRVYCKRISLILLIQQT